MYTELFKLCGFEPEEIERERPRIDKAFQILEIGAEDISQAQERVTEFFDTELLGVRKALGIWMKRLINLVLAKEEGKMIIYPCWPTDPRVVAAGALVSDKVLCETPEMVIDIALGQIFGKINPILEAAEQHGMPPGLGMCSLNQARLGGIAKGIVPVPDVTLTASHMCDQSAKTDELLHEVYGVHNIFFDQCLDSNWDEFPGFSPRRIEYFATEIRQCLEELQEVVGDKLTEEALRTARVETAKLGLAMNQIWELMKADPQPISQVDVGLLYWMVMDPERVTLNEGVKTFGILTEEIKNRVDQGKGVVEKGAPKVVLSIHQSTDPSFLHMVESLGLAIPVSAFLWVAPWERAKSEVTSFEEKTALIQMRKGLAHSTSGWLQLYKECCRAFDADGFLLFYLFSCRPFAIAPLIMKKSIEDELGIPVLALEGDAYDTRDYSTEALRTRVETFAEMLKMSKAAKA